MLRNRTPVRSQPRDAWLAPSARDLLRNLDTSANHKSPRAEKRPPPAAPNPVTAGSSKADLEAFFNSPPIHKLKLQICDIGRRMWQRAYVDGNGGNIAIRVGEDLALCTPTLGLQRLHEPRGHVPGGPRGQPALRGQGAHE